MPQFEKDKMKIFVNFPTAEREIDAEITRNVKQILLSKAINGSRTPVEVINTYLTDKEWERRLKAIIGLSGGSLERLKRIYTAITGNRFPSNLNKDASARATVAEFLASPEDFSSDVPKYIRRCFRLRKGWIEALKDVDQVTAMVIDSCKSSYAVTVWPCTGKEDK